MSVCFNQLLLCSCVILQHRSSRASSIHVFVFSSLRSLPRASRGGRVYFSARLFSLFSYIVLFYPRICTFLLSLLPYQVCSLSASLVFYFFSIQLGWDTVGLFMLAALPSCPLWGLLPPPSFLKTLRKSRRARRERNVQKKVF